MLWRQIKEHTAEFIDPIYLPTNSGDQVVQLEDPSDMKKEQIVGLLEHWRRPVPASDLFQFSHVLVNSKSGEMEWAWYKNSLGSQLVSWNSLALATDELATWDEEYVNPTSMVHWDPNIDPTLQEERELGQESDHVSLSVPPLPTLVSTEPQPKQKPKNRPNGSVANPSVTGNSMCPTMGDAGNGLTASSSQPAIFNVLTQEEREHGNCVSPSVLPWPSLVPTQPWPKPKPKNKPDGSAANQSATSNGMCPTDDAGSGPATSSSHPPAISKVSNRIPLAASINQIEGALGRPHREPKKWKLDACLTIQFKAVGKERERGQAK